MAQTKKVGKKKIGTKNNPFNAARKGAGAIKGLGGKPGNVGAKIKMPKPKKK